MFALLGVSSRPASAGARVVINEIYYDHPGADDGWEYIELYNAGDMPVGLAGARLEALDGRTAASRVVWTAPDGLNLPPGGYLLVAGIHRASDSPLLTSSLENGPDAVRLVLDGESADLVGYGEPLPPFLSEGVAAVDAPPGSSLARMPDGRDTDDNRLDFAVSDPTPGRVNVHRRDLRLAAVVTVDSPPCRGEPLAVSVVIENAGFEAYTGGASVGLFFIDGCRRSRAEELELYCTLDVSAADTVLLRLAPPSAERLHIEAVLAAEADKCPLNDTCRTVVCTSPGAMVINEIMYRPHGGGGEWIELLNTGAGPCELTGWEIRDAAGAPRIVTKWDLAIETGGFLVLAQHPDRVRRLVPAGVPVIGIEGGWPALNDRGDGGAAEIISLYDRAGVLVERVAYRDMLGEERGRSIERASEHLCSADPGGIWHRCVSPDGSTPGAENSVSSPGGTSEGSIRIAPNPFCAARHGATAISGARLPSERGVTVRIFDVDGFEVRRLFGEEQGARIFTVRWDGRDERGIDVETGLYICLVEYVGRGGGVCRTERECIAVFGRR